MSIPGGVTASPRRVITDPHQNCVLMHTRLEAEAEMLAKLRLFALLAPHLESGGRGNFGNVVQTNWGKVLTAHKGAPGSCWQPQSRFCDALAVMRERPTAGKTWLATSGWTGNSTVRRMATSL